MFGREREGAVDGRCRLPVGEMLNPSCLWDGLDGVPVFRTPVIADGMGRRDEGRRAKDIARR